MVALDIIPRPPLFIRFLNIFLRSTANVVADYPITVTVVTLIITLISSSKIPITQTEDNFKIGYTPVNARSLKEMKLYQDFTEGELVMLMVFITAKDGGTMLRAAHLNETVNLVDYIGTHFAVNNATYYQFCTSFCAANEPVVQFRNGFIIQEGEVIRNGKPNLESMNLSYPFTTMLIQDIDMTPNFFGVETWNYYERPANATTNIKDLRLILLMFRADKPKNWDVEDINQWNRLVAKYFLEYENEFIIPRILSFPYTQDELIRTTRALLPYLSVGFAIMCAISVASVFAGAIILDQWSMYKAIYAVNACVCPTLASAAALGFLFWCGFRFGSILLVTPFLVLAIGVDDAFIMINSWERLHAERVRNPVQNDSLKIRLGEVLVDIGPSITITSLTNIMAFTVSAFSPVPEIRLFCISNVVAMAFDYFYTLTLFAAILCIFAKYEIKDDNNKIFKEKTDKIHNVGHLMSEFVTSYCEWLSSKFTFTAIFIALIIYWSISIYGAVQVRPGLTPSKLFISDSPLVKVNEMRSEFIDTHYSFVTIFVNNAGNLSEPKRIKRIMSLVGEYESMVECNGREYTHIWIRDYEKFIEAAKEDAAELGDTTTPYSAESVDQFLEWPEYRHWGGFIKRNNQSKSIEKFFFIVKYHGHNMSEWDEKLRMLTSWRNIADRYPDLSASVFEDESLFTDQLPMLLPLTLQTSICTLICMAAACFLFINSRGPVIVASLSIFSIFLGVFGILSLWDISLDPISMTVIVLSIGLSVDFPAHISYHYCQSTFDPNTKTPVQAMARCLSYIGFPLLQCCVSSIFYIFCLLFVDCYFSEIFVKAVVLVIIVSTVHAFIVIPGVLCALSKNK